MYCRNCGNLIAPEDNFCKNCGQPIQTEKSNDQKDNVNQLNSNFNESKILTKENKKKNILVIIIGLIIGLAVIFYIIGGISKDNSGLDDNVSEDNNPIKGLFSRDIFSGNSFDYITIYDQAIFTFNSDSTFECTYLNGVTYRGVFEVYNGLYISIKADEIANDSNIQNADSLAADIEKVANKMMSNSDSMLNTYLLYLTVEETVNNNVTNRTNIIQPFVIQYETSTNTGIAVNILGQTQGTLAKN